MSSRGTPLVASVALLVLIAPTTSLAHQPGLESAEEIEQELDAVEAVEIEQELATAESDLGEAVRSFEQIEARIHDAEEQVAAAEQRLAAATAALAGLVDEVRAAEQALAAAERAAAVTEAALIAAEARAERAERAERDAVELLQVRTIEVFKNGVGRDQQAMVAGVIGAKDWHDVTVTTSAFSRILTEDRDLVAAATRTRQAARESRADADVALVAAVAAEQAAAAEQAGLLGLLEEQQAAVVAVADERRRREGVIEALQQDGEVTALLVNRLQEQVLALASLPPPPPPPPPPPEAEAAPEPEREPEREPETVPDATPDPDPPVPEAPPIVEAPPDTVPAWSSRLPARGQPFAADIDVAAQRYGLDGRLLAALVWTESAFDPNAVSWVGAIGLAQLMPGTAAYLGVDPWIPTQNLDGGARYLSEQLARFGSIELALAAYNAGPGAVSRFGGVPPYNETRLYVVRVLERYQHIAA